MTPSLSHAAHRSWLCYFVGERLRGNILHLHSFLWATSSPPLPYSSLMQDLTEEPRHLHEHRSPTTSLKPSRSKFWAPATPPSCHPRPLQSFYAIHPRCTTPPLSSPVPKMSPSLPPLLLFGLHRLCKPSPHQSPPFFYPISAAPSVLLYCISTTTSEAPLYHFFLCWSTPVVAPRTAADRALSIGKGGESDVES
jgi:hypothetical protein